MAFFPSPGRSSLRRRPGRPRDERGVAFPSPVVMLSVLAVAMAGCQAVQWFAPPATLTTAFPLSALAAYILLTVLAWWMAHNRELKR